jgi:hypothetical protein
MEERTKIRVKPTDKIAAAKVLRFKFNLDANSIALLVKTNVEIVRAWLEAAENQKRTNP